MARHALSLPLWTLNEGLPSVCERAETTVEKLVASLESRAEGNLPPEQLRAQNGMDNRSTEQIALERASYLLDLGVAAPERFAWESMRADLADLYEKAGMSAFGSFVCPD